MANEVKKERAVKADSNPSPLEPKKRKKGNKLLIFFFILLAVGITGFVFRKQIGRLLSNNLKGVPIVNQFFKEQTDPYGHLTKDKVIQELEQKKREQEQLNQEILDLEEQNAALEQKINALKEYETKYEEFISQKEAWDERIAKTDPKMFVEQFEKIYPETAEKIYKDIKIDTIITKQQKEFASTVGQMDADQAAKALETLIPSDPELIKLVFQGMEQERKALILSGMQASNAATVIKLLSPDAMPNRE